MAQKLGGTQANRTARVFQVRAIRVLNPEGPSLSLNDLSQFPALKEALRKADEDLRRVLTAYPVEYYDSILAPSIVQVEEAEARAIGNLLECPIEEVTIRPARLLVYGGNRYAVKVTASHCG